MDNSKPNQFSKISYSHYDEKSHQLIKESCIPDRNGNIVRFKTSIFVPLEDRAFVKKFYK